MMPDLDTNGRLAVLAPLIGLQSETFIRRHVEDLLPGRTVAIVRSASNGEGGWTSGVPTLVLDRLRRQDGWRRFSRTARRLGWQPVSKPAQHVQRFLEETGTRVILGEYLDESWRWISLARKMGIRFVGHAHGYDVSMKIRDPKWRVRYRDYNDTAGVIAVSRDGAERLAEAGVDRSKIHVVPCGVDVPLEPTIRDERRVVKCLAVGRMVGKKAPILLLEAFRRAVARNNRLCLDVVGGGPLLPAARQFVQAFALGNKVTLHGSQPSSVVASLLTAADIFLQYSITDPDSGDQEGLPVAVLEAMASALPVVSTWHAGIPEAVADGVTGFLVNEADGTAMTERILELASDADLRRRMGREGWRVASGRFSWQLEQAALLDILAP